MSEHISRKELKHDKIRESIEHGAEAVYSHSKAAGLLVALILIVVAGYAGWKFYSDRQNLQASAMLDEAMKTYSARVRVGNEPAEAGEITFSTEPARAEAAVQKFAAVAGKYPSTSSGRLASYYQSLALEDLEKHNQALEELKKLSSGSDKELAAMALYQIANIYARTGKPEEAVKTYRTLADSKSVLVPRPLVLIELADLLRQTNPSEATNLYQQIKKDYPDSAIAERADRGLGMLAPRS